MWKLDESMKYVFVCVLSVHAFMFILNFLDLIANGSANVCYFPKLNRMSSMGILTGLE